MHIARIENGVVVNIEVADQAYLDAHLEANLVPYPDTAPATIGLRYDPARGFEQPRRAKFADHEVPLLDADGQPVTDSDGQPVTYVPPVTDKNGDIVYLPAEWVKP